MKEKVIITENIEIIYTNDGEFGFEEVLNDFEKAKKIYIITYNISKFQKYLLNYLKKSNEDSEIILVTNIPGRFESYGAGYAKKAKEVIESYKSQLNRKGYKGKLTWYYNVKNHSKIIGTENILYVGSQNFSDESKNNHEVGTIIKNKEIINNIINDIIVNIIDDSLNPSQSILSEIKIELSSCIPIFIDFLSKIHDNFFCWSDDYPHIGEWREYFSPYLAYETFKEKDYENLLEFFESVKEILNKSEEVDSENFYEKFYKKLEEIRKSLKSIPDLFNGSLYEFILLDEEKYIQKEIGYRSVTPRILERLQQCFYWYKDDIANEIKKEDFLILEEKIKECIKNIENLVIELDKFDFGLDNTNKL